MFYKLTVTCCRWFGVLLANEHVDCHPSRGRNKHAQDRKRCSLLDDDSTATAGCDSYTSQIQNHDYKHMTTAISYKSTFTARYITFKLYYIAKLSVKSCIKSTRIICCSVYNLPL